jgi:hypothetical protein
MHPDDYRRFTSELTRWAQSRADVLGLVAVGSTADASHAPDQWSDHDVFVVTAPGVAAALRDDLSWLPDAERIVMVLADTEHGGCVVYDDGHMIEMAALDEDELHVLSVNDHRVLLDRGGIAAQIATLADHTATRVSTADPSGSHRRDTFGPSQRSDGPIHVGLSQRATPSPGEQCARHRQALDARLVPTPPAGLSENGDAR